MHTQHPTGRLCRLCFAVVFFAMKKSLRTFFFTFSVCFYLGSFIWSSFFFPINHHICRWLPAPNTFQTLVCKYAISVTGLIILHMAVLLCHSSTDLLHSFRAWISVLCVWVGELTGNQLSACMFACALLSITATSFCNYTLHCTQTRHQVGPEPTSTAPPALITVVFWKILLVRESGANRGPFAHLRCRRPAGQSAGWDYKR